MPVIVVGSGLAGLSAASQLITHKVPVHLLERAEKPGGNSIKASSGINGAPTRFQTYPDSKFYNDTLRSAGTSLRTATGQRESLISKLTESSSAAISWLVDTKGIDLSHVAQLGGHSLPRTHRGSGKLPPGAAIVTALLNDLKASPLFTLETSAQVTKVLQDKHGAITGVELTTSDEGGSATKVLNGPVIFCSGGFAGDTKGMLAEYRIDLAGYPSTNEPREGSQKLLTSVGAQLLDMDRVQVHPTAFVDVKDPSNPVKFLAAELLRGEGGILLLEGKRFVNEMQTREHITNAITEKSPMDISPRQWNVEIVLDESTYKAAASHVDFYLWKGLMKKVALADLDTHTLTTLRRYSEIVRGRVADPLSRRDFGNWDLNDVAPDSVLYVGRVTPAIHFTMGGVIIDDHSHVLNEQGIPINGLWAAGEVTGGIHGDNRLGGSSLLECVVFGRIAGDQAASYQKNK